MNELQQEKNRELTEKVEQEMKNNPAVVELIEKYGAKIKEIKII